MYIDDLHFFDLDDIAATFRFCAVTGITVIAAGIELQVDSGSQFPYVSLPSTLIRMSAAKCHVCSAPACADVLTAQATGKTHFRLAQDLVGDVQWEGRCKQCYKEWHDKYGFPTLVS